MRDVVGELAKWWHEGTTIGMATVVKTTGSAPQRAGATMLVGPEGQVVGSVSGGCIESAVHELALEVTETRRPVSVRYSEDGSVFSLGLTCGGTIEVFVEAVDRTTFPELGRLLADVTAGRAVASATVLSAPDAQLTGRHLVLRPGDTRGTLGSSLADELVHADLQAALSSGRTRAVSYDLSPGLSTNLGTPDRLAVFVTAHLPPPRLIIFGAIDFAAAVSRAGAFLGFRVTVCDARATFCTPERFPEADQVVVDWPHRYLATEHHAGRLDGRTAICVLTHDEKFDLPLLETALRLPAPAYLGAMGSRRTHAQRLDRLREAGLGEDRLRRLSGPIGLDLGAQTPAETAISVVAEIIAQQRGGSGAPLSELDGPIHKA